MEQFNLDGKPSIARNGMLAVVDTAASGVLQEPRNAVDRCAIRTVDEVGLLGIADDWVVQHLPLCECCA